jgi:uncharacterized protein YggL (DUF469 family)
MLESNELGMGGGGDRNGIEGAVQKNKGSVTLEEIEKVKSWMTGCTEIKNVSVGGLIDMWN